MTDKPLLQELPVGDVIPTPDNPRMTPHPEAISELAASIREIGVLHPVIVRPHPDQLGKYDLRAGSRRLAAAIEAGLDTLPAIVREMDDRTAMEITICENMQRENLHPLEEAQGLKTLFDRGWEVDAVAAHLGKHERWVRRRAELMNLTPEWVTAIRTDPLCGQLSAGHLEAIARLPWGTQAEWLHDLDDLLHCGPSGSFPTVADFARRTLTECRLFRGMPWDTADEALHPMVACDSCADQSGADPLLFDDMEDVGNRDKNNRCLDPECFALRAVEWANRAIGELREKHGENKVVALYQGDPRRPEGINRVPSAASQSGFATATAKTPGALRALYIWGPSLGKQEWVRPVNRQVSEIAGDKPAFTSAASNDAASTAPANKTRRTMAEKREALDLKRRAYIATSMRNHLDMLIDDHHACQKLGAKRSTNIAALMLAFGRVGVFDMPDDGEAKDTAGLERFEQFEAIKARESKVVIGAMMRAALVMVRDALFCRSDVDLDDAEAVADLCDWEFSPYVLEAERKLPEPKSWAKAKAAGNDG